MDWLFQMVCSSQYYNKSYSISLFNIFRSPHLIEVFPHYIVPPDPFLIVHLFIIQPCTQVYVLLNSFFGFLWAVVVESTVQRSSPH